MHWLETAKLPKPEDQIQLAQECAEKDYSVRELQAQVKKRLNPPQAGPEAPKPEEGTERPFQFTRKGKELVIRSRQVPQTYILDTYMQELRCALVAFLTQEETASVKTA